MHQNNILLIQDDPADAQTVLQALINSNDDPFHVVWLRRCSEGVAHLSQGEREGRPATARVAAVLVDLFLPDSQGIETFERLFCAAPHAPILVLSSLQNENIAKLAVQRGAQDYLLKERIDNYILPKTLQSMIGRSAITDALFQEKERAQVTLNSIGDAVISTDVAGHVTYLNSVAEDMTGWTMKEAAGHPIEEVFRILYASTREAALNPMALALRENKTVGRAANCVLIRRDGVEAAIEDSAAPIHDRLGHVTGAVMVFHDVTMARAMSLKMSYLAQHDGLTDLPNRIMFHDRLDRAIALARRRQQKLALLFVDVDRFKPINDSIGHCNGDRLLQSVAQRLQACVRSSDTVSRQGGDEFVILLAQVARAEDAAAVAEHKLRALRAPHRSDGPTCHIPVMLGLVPDPGAGIETEVLMNHADLAMYHAKDRGRDNYQFFRPEMNARVVERQALECGLRRGIERQEFVLHYQPKVSLRTGAIVGVEALVRWRHPQRGLVLPAQFIPVAEECGLIVPIGRCVMREACRQTKAWHNAGLPHIPVAINVSALELRARDAVSGVRTILTQTELESRYVELELTESFLMQDLESTAAVLGALKDMGVKLALDDFGTGYSSLNYLKRLPIDTLKIDRTFVSDLGTNTDDASIVNAAITLGQSLHMQVVAEGVETREQVAFLQQHGCSVGQGFYFSQPVTAKAFAKLLSREVPDRLHAMASA